MLPRLDDARTAIDAVIEDFVIYSNEEHPLEKAVGESPLPIAAPVVLAPKFAPERLAALHDPAQLRALYVDHGLSRNAIARKLGVSRSAVGDALKRYGLAKKEPPAARRHPGQVPFGWDWKEGKLTKNPAEQKTIRWMRQMQKAGKSLREIARVLNEKNVPTKNGGVWQANTVRKILVPREPR